MKKLLWVCALVLISHQVVSCTKQPLIESVEDVATEGEKEQPESEPEG